MYARANLLVQLHHAQHRFTSFVKSVHDGNVEQITIQNEMNAIGSEVKCAAAEIYVLLIDRPKYSDANADWSHDVDCMKRYNLYVYSGDRKIEGYRDSITRQKFTNADKELYEMFDFNRDVGFFFSIILLLVNQ